MNIPEEFGNYLLLKKLREDALGETFRAGRVGRDGIEQVVLLRVFNGQGMDGEKLWQRISGRAPVQQALRSPNIGSGVDLGKVRSFPYAAYDYISGKNLATLFAQAARQRQPIPIDHALLIAERLSLALAAAYETRAQDERLLHGFVVPHLAMISNEGETRMLGFEVAPGLRDLWTGGWRHDDLRGYLAPETAATAAVAKTDDVYSLGAILFELLASERLPLSLNSRGGPADGAAAYGSMAALIDGLVLPNEGTPLPAAVAALLKKSLAPPEQRIPDAVTWHKTISKLMIDGQFSSTTFNLAFFMHNLFRDEIDRESQEIEAEKKLELPPRLAAGVAGIAGAAGVAAAAGAGSAALAAGAAGPATTHAGAAGAADARERTGVRDAGWAAGAAGAGQPLTAGAAASDRKPLWIGLAAAVLLAIGAGGYFLFGRTPAKPAAQPAAVSPADSARSAAALQAQIQQMIEARSKDIESKLKSQYDDNIKQLQKQLDQKKLEESRKAATAGQDKEKDKARERAAATSGPESAGQTAAESRLARGEKGERSEAPSSAPASGATAGSRTAAAQPPAPAARESAASPAATQAPAPAATPQAPLSPAAEAGGGRQPQVQVGDLVQAGPGVVLPKIVYRPETRYPPAARRMNRSAEVTVRALVDEKGRVEKAERVGAAVGMGFDEAAVEVARLSSYNPATKDGVRVKMWISMKVTFVP
jgi:TonB family protein